MAIYFAGQAFTKAYLAGMEISKIQVGASEVFEKPADDTAGTLTLVATRASRGASFVITLADTDGVRSVTAADMTGNRGRSANADVVALFARTDANTFAARFARNNNRFREGFIDVTYVDAASGASHTLRQTWNV